MKKILAEFKVNYIQVLDERGEVDKKLMPKFSKNQIKNMYELMLLTRAFDEKALLLQRQGRLGTYAVSRGQEAAQIGSALALKNDDWVVPSFREQGVFIALGYPLHQLYQYWGWDERGMNIPKKFSILPITIPVSAQIPHAVGIAYALKLRNEKKVVACYFGDGGTSKGDFHEGLNMAGVWALPVVFICQNNQWAISVSRKKQSASKTLAQKAISYGFEGIQVDGNDVFGIYKVVSEAVKKARSGKGPSLIECFTYRIGDHTTSDDASRYRSKKEVESWIKKDPIERLRKYMKKKEMWTKMYEKQLKKKIGKQVKEAVERFEKIPKQNPEEMFRYVYAEMPWFLKEEMRDI